MQAHRTFPCALCLLLLLPGFTAQAQQTASPTLPDIPQLMSELPEHQKQLEKVRENYPYSDSNVVEEIDGKGQVTKTETRDSEVFFINGQPIERLVKKDGKPLTDQEAQKEAERVNKAVEKAEKPQLEQPKEDQQISLRHMLYVADVRNPRRENFRGRTTLIYDFVGKKNFKAHGLSEDLSKKIQGTIWIDEADRQVARVEASLDDNFHIAGGLVANLQKGSRFSFDQAPMNGEIWLPTGAEVSLQMRLLLFKGIRQHMTERDYNYKRFHVEAEQGKGVKVAAEK